MSSEQNRENETVGLKRFSIELHKTAHRDRVDGFW